MEAHHVDRLYVRNASNSANWANMLEPCRTGVLYLPISWEFCIGMSRLDSWDVHLYNFVSFADDINTRGLEERRLTAFLDEQPRPEFGNGQQTEIGTIQQVRVERQKSRQNTLGEKLSTISLSGKWTISPQTKWRESLVHWKSCSVQPLLRKNKLKKDRALNYNLFTLITGLFRGNRSRIS